LEPQKISETNNSFSNNTNKSGIASKPIILLVIGFFIFSFGYGLGRGNINFYQNFERENLSQVSKGLPKNLNYAEVEQLYDLLRTRYDGQLNESKLIEGLKQGLVSAADDRYTQYMNPKEAKEFEEDLNGTFSGIGASLVLDSNKMVMIETPLAGYPAEKAGLKARDVIIEVNGESAVDFSVSEAVEKIRGEAGTKVKLKVLRDNKEQLDFEITRETITIPGVESKILDGNIGYMQVSRFDSSTGQLAQEAARKFKDARVRGVILDLRNNPGGDVDAAVVVPSIWLPKGKTVLQEKRNGVTIKTYESEGIESLKGIPTVVLINEGSASASEIVAGALKDNNVATLLGEKTFGKGSVQTKEGLPDGGALKVTIARWYTPNGKNVDKEGIEPDKKVSLSIEDVRSGIDPQKDAAVELLKK